MGIWSSILDPIPGVGHIKGFVHYVRGEKEKGHEAMIKASRTCFVAAGGIAGAATGGIVLAPVVAIVAGVDYDVVHSVITQEEQGTFKTIQKAINDPTAENIAPLALQALVDASTGIAGEQIYSHVMANPQLSMVGIKPGLLTNAEIILPMAKGALKAAEVPLTAAGAASVALKMIEKSPEQHRYEWFENAGIKMKEHPEIGNDRWIPIFVELANSKHPEIAIPLKEYDGKFSYFNSHCRLPFLSLQSQKNWHNSPANQSYPPITTPLREQLATVITTKPFPYQGEEEVFECVKADFGEFGRWSMSANRTPDRDNGNSQQRENSFRAPERPLRVLQWNAGGFRAQLIKEWGFMYLLAQIKPDVIMLNELKCPEENMQEIARRLEYEIVMIPSRQSTKNDVRYRGSAILFRPRRLTLDRGSIGVDHLSNGGEIVWANFRDGETTRRFVNVYLNGSNEFHECLGLLLRLSDDHWTLIGGDFNTGKNFEKSVEILKGRGLFSCANPNYRTNRWSGNSGTTIDYVLGRENVRRDVLCHRPIQPDATARSVHFPMVYDIEEGINEKEKFCEGEECFFGCEPENHHEAHQ